MMFHHETSTHPRSRTASVMAVPVLIALVTSALGQELLFELDGRFAADQFGRSIVSLGDLDADGVHEFAVASYDDGTGGIRRGSVAVYSGASRVLRYRLEGAGPNDRFGRQLAAVDDVDGDGHADLLVAAGLMPQAAPPQGRVEVRSGVNGALLYTLAAASAGSGVVTFGESIGAAGDLDLDGVGDFFVFVTGINSGRVRLYSGATGAFLREHTGGPEFGRATVSTGDLDGDGVGELAVGDPTYLQLFPIHRGRVQIISGAAGALLRTHLGDATTVVFPKALGNAGDVDRDGVDELVVAFEREQLWSDVHLHSGANGGVLRTIVGRESGDDFGRALADVGDVDGDGFVDLAIGAPAYHNGLANAGAVYVHSGADGRELFRVSGTTEGHVLGSGLAGIGDLDGDGLADVLIGAPRSPTFGGPAGRVFGYGFVANDVTFDFDQDDDLMTPLENGRAISAGSRFGRFLQFAGLGSGHFGPATFDSSPNGPNAGGPDPDLLVDRGNLVVLQATGAQTVPGIFDVPNDFAGGGTVTIELLQPGRVISLDLVDIDARTGEGAAVRLRDGAGRVRHYAVAPGYTGDVALGSGVRTLDLQTLFLQRGDLGDTTASEDAGFEPATVSRIEVVFTGSGGFDAVRVRLNERAELGLRHLWSVDDPNSPGSFTYGQFLSRAGDLDGDGRDDLLVGEQAGSAPFVEVLAGADGTALRRFVGRPGSVTHAIGGLDLDGDLTPDVVVGGDLDETPALPDSGAARAYAGATGALLWSRRGRAGERLGARVLGMGDLDGDGRDEVALIPSSQTALDFRVPIVSGATGVTLWTATSPSYNVTFGSGLDHDGDGRQDLLVGLPSDALSAGRLQVYSGATGALLVEHFGAAPGVQLGLKVGALGDVDGDGRVEILVGQRSPSSTFVTHVVSGADLTTTLFVVEGLAVAGGDLDGDGTRDILAVFVVPGSAPNERSAVEGRSGRGGALLFRKTRSVETPFHVVADAGDADGDGFDDVAWSRVLAPSSHLDLVEVHALARANGAAVCFGAANSTGFRARLETEGSYQVAANALRLVAIGVPSGTPALLLSSGAYGVVAAPAIGGITSDGDLCIGGGTVTRHGAALAAGLVATFPLDLDALPTVGVPGGVRAAFPGETRYWQCWYRDHGSAGRSNFSDALRVTFE